MVLGIILGPIAASVLEVSEWGFTLSDAQISEISLVGSHTPLSFPSGPGLIQ